MSKRKFTGRSKNNLFLIVAIKEAEYFSKKQVIQQFFFFNHW